MLSLWKGKVEFINNHYIDVTWTSWRLKSPAIPLFFFNRLTRHTSNLCPTGLCEGNPPAAGGFPSQMASNAENGSNSWRHREYGEILQRHSALRDIECGGVILVGDSGELGRAMGGFCDFRVYSPLLHSIVCHILTRYSGTRLYVVDCLRLRFLFHLASYTLYFVLVLFFH